MEERECGDRITRWYIRLDSVDEANKILADDPKIRRDYKLKVGPDSTFIQRQTKSIVEKRAEKEKAIRADTKIKTEGPWICVNGKWERWLEKEARWTTEAEWNRERKKEEIRAAERKLERLRREVEKENAEDTQLMEEREKGEDGHVERMK